MGKFPTTATIISLLTTKVKNVGTPRGGVEQQIEANETPIDTLRNECFKRLNESLVNRTNFGIDKFCPGTFDGWHCWPDTLAGTIAYAPCPKHITGFDPSRNAFKECDINGEWYKNPETNQIWSNYTTCINNEDLEWKQKINLIYKVGYIISLVAILLALFILGYFKALKCARITLHINLFTSFAFDNSLWILWFFAVVPNFALLQQNPPACIIFFVVMHYFLITNYIWMLCECIYLYTVLVYAFVSERKMVKLLIAFGWISPVVYMLIYGFVRGFAAKPQENLYCWISATKFDNILNLPVSISIMLNAILLSNIIRVVILKLRSPAGGQNIVGTTRTVLRAFRALFILVPLLSLHYVISPFRPEPGHPFEHTFDIILAITDSFQGLFVAFSFCFCNSDVAAQLKRKWRNTFPNDRFCRDSCADTIVLFLHCVPVIPGKGLSSVFRTRSSSAVSSKTYLLHHQQQVRNHKPCDLLNVLRKIQSFRRRILQSNLHIFTL